MFTYVYTDNVQLVRVYIKGVSALDIKIVKTNQEGILSFTRETVLTESKVAKTQVYSKSLFIYFIF